MAKAQIASIAVVSAGHIETWGEAMPMYRWADLEEVPLNPLIKGRVVEVPNAMLARIKAPKGPINMHTHDFDQITHMLAGKMRWVIEGEEPRIVGPGDVLLMSAGVAHGGEVLEDAEYLDIFAAPGLQLVQAEAAAEVIQFKMAPPMASPGAREPLKADGMQLVYRAPIAYLESGATVPVAFVTREEPNAVRVRYAG